MRILSFDTSTNAVHLCLSEGRDVVNAVEISQPSADRKEIGSVLMPEIDRAVREANWKKSDIDLVVVGIGPGSFTGIRVGVITARTLAQVLNIGAVGVPLLETYYFGANVESPAAVILSTTSNQFFYGGYRRDAKTGEPVAAAAEQGCGPLETLAQQLASMPLWFGDEKACEVSKAGSHPCQPLPAIKNIAATQSQLAFDRLSLLGLGNAPEAKERLAETFDWENVLPLYLRSPSVTVKKTYAP